MGSKYVLRMRLNKWSDMEASIGGSIRVPVNVGHSAGFLEVFKTLEDYHRDYPEEEMFTYIEETAEEFEK